MTLCQQFCSYLSDVSKKVLSPLPPDTLTPSPLCEYVRGGGIEILFGLRNKRTGQDLTTTKKKTTSVESRPTVVYNIKSCSTESHKTPKAVLSCAVISPLNANGGGIFSGHSKHCPLHLQCIGARSDCNWPSHRWQRKALHSSPLPPHLFSIRLSAP